MPFLVSLPPDILEWLNVPLGGGRRLPPSQSVGKGIWAPVSSHGWCLSSDQSSGAPLCSQVSLCFNLLVQGRANRGVARLGSLLSGLSKTAN